MQRCPYIHEMRERFINETPRQVQMMRRIDRERDIAEREGLINPRQSSAVSDASINQVGTVVKVLLAITRAQQDISFNFSNTKYILLSFNNYASLFRFGHLRNAFLYINTITLTDT